MPKFIALRTLSQFLTIHAYAELASVTEIASLRDGLDACVAALVARIETLLNLAGIPRSLADAGVDVTQIPQLAAEAARQWTVNFNPRPLTSDDFVALYRASDIPRGEGDAR